MAIWLERNLGIRSSPLQCLDELPGIKVKEKVRKVEALSGLIFNFLNPAVEGLGFEQTNQYKVFRHTPGQHTGWDDLFYVREQTSAVSRNLQQFPMLRDCMAWNMSIRYCQGVGGEEPAFHITRPASCTCLCFNRPEAHVTDSEGTELGTFQDPFSWSTYWDGVYNFTVCDSDGMSLFEIAGGCSEDDDAKKIEFTVIGSESRESVATIRKKAPKRNFFQAEDLDNYYVDFGSVSEPKHKALLMALTLFMDMRYFNGSVSIPVVDAAMGGYAPLG